MVRRREVQPGQTYRRAGVNGSLWQVVWVRKDDYGVVHAQLMRVDEPVTRKTLAVSTVLDPEQFERVDGRG